MWGTDAGGAVLGEEALDWLTLVRLLGWSVAIGDRGAPPPLGPPAPDVVLVTGDAAALGSAWLETLERWLETERVLVVAGAAAAGTRWAGLSGAAIGPPSEGGGQASGRLRWCGPGPPQEWTEEEPVPAHRLELLPGADPWATVAGAAVLAARTRPGAGTVVTTAVSPSEVRARSAAGTGLSKRLLTHGTPAPTAWFDLANSVLLRMDDPGASANVHLESWAHAKLDEDDWREVGDGLEVRGARLSVAYTPGWVDDGDPRRGELSVAGAAAERHPGAVHPSPLVVHVDQAGHAPGRINDYSAEFRGVERLRTEGKVGVELHGYTHVRPDLEHWARASDRYENVSWYREFAGWDEPGAAPGGAAAHPLSLGLELLRRHFGEAPTTFVCPGQGWSDSTLVQALELGLPLVSADGLALRDGGSFCWCAGVPAVYVDKPDGRLLESGLPTIAYFHDHDLALSGVDWMFTQIDRWRRAGARRLIDFRELAAVLALRLDLRPRPTGGWRLVAEDVAGEGPALPRPFPVQIRVPGAAPGHVELEYDGRSTTLAAHRLADGGDRVVLPAGLRAGQRPSRVSAA